MPNPKPDRGERPRRRFGRGYEVGVPILLGILVLLVVALLIVAVIVLLRPQGPAATGLLEAL